MGTPYEAGKSANEVLPPKTAELITPAQTAIIVVDVMDAYFASNGRLAKLTGHKTTQLDATAKRINSFLEEARKYSPAAVVFTRMVERPDSLPPNLAAKMEEMDTPALVEENGEGWNYYGVSPQAGDHEITKTHYNAFTGTDLDAYLKSKGVKSVIIVGGFGSRCVARTAGSASDDYGYNTFVLPDLIANSDSVDKPGQPAGVDEIAGFLQGFNIILGYTPSAQTVLNTWKSQTPKPSLPTQG